MGTYKKANSFHSLYSHVDGETEEAMCRLATLKEKLGDLKLSIKQLKVLTDAFSQLGNEWIIHPHTAAEIVRLQETDLPNYLIYRFRYDVNPTRLVVDEYPPLIQIEPTSICNYRCVFCYQTNKALTAKKNGHMGMMSFNLFREIIDQIEGHVQGITLASRGEPLLNPNLPEMLHYAAPKFLGFKVNTNLSKLTEEKAHAFFQAKVDTLVISADAAEEPLYSKLRVNGNLNNVLEKSRMLRDIRAKHYSDSQTILRVSGVKVQKDQNLAQMEKLWGEIVDQVSFVNYNPWENPYDADLSQVTAPCSDLWRRLFVWWDGRCNPCDVDYLSHLEVGHLGKKTLHEIWNGTAYQELREKHLRKRRSSISPCNRCVVI